MREVHARGARLWVIGSRVPFRPPRSLHLLALGPEFNRQVLGNPQDFHSIPLTIPAPRGSAQRRIQKGLTALNTDFRKASTVTGI